MTREEAAALLAVVAGTWPHSTVISDTPEATVNLWHGFLVGVAYDAAAEAVREMALTGRSQAPVVGQVVRAACEREDDSPEWDEAWEEVQRLVRRYGPYALRGGRGPSELGAPPESVFSHPTVAAFAIPAWRELCAAPAGGVNGYGTHYAQQRDAYKALRARGLQDRGLLLVGAPRRSTLRRLTAEGSGMVRAGEREPSDRAVEPAGAIPARAGRAAPRPGPQVRGPEGRL